jgi:hypothetical protein
MYRVDITADLNDEDETGYVWTFLDEARDPRRIKPGAIVVAGDQDAAAVCEVIDPAPAGDGTIIHLRLLPGLVEGYRALVNAPWLANVLRDKVTGGLEASFAARRVGDRHPLVELALGGGR